MNEIIIIWPNEGATRKEIGGKAYALAQLRRADVAVPPWFVIRPNAGRGVPDELSEEARNSIRNAVRTLADGAPVAVRSSAVEEDAEEHSWAGQMESFLMVNPEEVPERVVDVWRSVYGDEAESYRKTHGLDEPAQPPAVLVQKMVLADCAGVAFSADPVSGRRGHCIVSAVRGAGSALVDGETDADTFTVNRDNTIVRCDLSAQQVVHELGPEGVTKRRLDPPENTPALRDEEVLAVAELARKAEAFFDRPQDIEWAMEDGTLYLLQSRPITTLRQMADPDGRTILWDNSNIAESYSGVTTPLTFSFARRAYTSVYESFCRVMKVDESVIEDHQETFQSMIGLIRGRLYYNLQSWYQMLALLPGFQFNRAFMEEMMGVRERMPAEFLPEPTRSGGLARAADLMHLVRSAAALLRQHRTLDEQIEAFQERLNDVLTPPAPGVERLRLDELADYYRKIEHDLLAEWDVPIVNDFMTMIFSGLSRRLVEKWGPDDSENLDNRLMMGLDDVISVEPARRIREMAAIVAGDDALTSLLLTGDRREIEPELQNHPTLREKYEAYLNRFSDRCLDELKLESPTVRDDPSVLFRAIGGMAKRLARDESAGPDERAMRREAEEELAHALKGSPMKRRWVDWSLRHARARIAARENLRFERTRVFGMARRLFLEMGRRLAAEGVLSENRDVFYLEVHEVLGFIDGTATTTELQGLADVRRREFDAHQDADEPAGRFTTHGAVPIGNTFTDHGVQADEDAGEAGEVRSGTGGCPGIVEGRIRVVEDPRQTKIEEGEILVARRTDPGWVALFTSARGIIVEHGNMLSHAAIVARELGIPAVVSVPGVTGWLATGDIVKMNGSTGLVERINPKE